MTGTKKIKKITLLSAVIFTALALILAALPFHRVALASQRTELEVIIQQQPGSTTATAQVYLHNSGGMAIGQLDATYDSNLFTVQDVTPGKLLEQGNFIPRFNINNPGIIIAGWLNYEEGTNKSGIIFEAVFSVPGGQALELNLQNIDLKKLDGTPIRIGGSGGSEIKLQIGNNQAQVDGVAITLETAPFIHEGRTMVPVRFVSEQLGADVDWLPDTRQVQIVDGPKKIVLTIDSTNAVVDGRQETLDVPAMITGGRTFVPLRFVSETLGAAVDWDGPTQTITIK